MSMHQATGNQTYSLNLKLERKTAMNKLLKGGLVMFGLFAECSQETTTAALEAFVTERINVK